MLPEIDPKDVIDALTQQRNAAMDEIARMAAVIKALQRQLKAEREEKS